MTAPAGAKIAVLGAGGGSAELLDFLLESFPIERCVVLDDSWPGGTRELLGVPVCGRLTQARELCENGFQAVLGIANWHEKGIRCRVASELAIPERAWLTYCHSSATVSSRATVGCGTVLYPGVRIGVGARIGRWCAVYYNTVVHHEVVLGDGVILCSSVSIAGGVTIGEGSYLGLGSKIREGLRLGRGVRVGMGAVVVRDVSDGVTVAGIPAEPVEE